MKNKINKDIIRVYLNVFSLLTAGWKISSTLITKTTYDQLWIDRNKGYAKLNSAEPAKIKNKKGEVKGGLNVKKIHQEIPLRAKGFHTH